MNKLYGMITALGLVAASVAQAATMESTKVATDSNALAVDNTGLISLDNNTVFVSLSTVAGETSFTIPTAAESMQIGANSTYAYCVETSPTRGCGASMVSALGAVTSSSASPWVVQLPGNNLTNVSFTTGVGPAIPTKVLVKAYNAGFNGSFSFRKH